MKKSLMILGAVFLYSGAGFASQLACTDDSNRTVVVAEIDGLNSLINIHVDFYYRGDHKVGNSSETRAGSPLSSHSPYKEMLLFSIPSSDIELVLPPSLSSDVFASFQAPRAGPGVNAFATFSYYKGSGFRIPLMCQIK